MKPAHKAISDADDAIADLMALWENGEITDQKAMSVLRQIRSMVDDAMNEVEGNLGERHD